MVTFNTPPNKKTEQFLDWWHGGRFLEMIAEDEKDPDRFKEIMNDGSLSLHEKAKAAGKLILDEAKKKNNNVGKAKVEDETKESNTSESGDEF